jgi:hypothetical protein
VIDFGFSAALRRPALNASDARALASRACALSSTGNRSPGNAKSDGGSFLRIALVSLLIIFP